MKASTAVAAGVGAVVVIGIGVLGIGLGLTPDSTFILQKDGGGVCQPSEPSPMSAGYGHQVTWAVKNVDCDPQFVILENFKHPNNKGGYDSPEKILKDDPVVDGPLKPGDGPLTLKTKVDKFVWWPKGFKYEIWLGPTVASAVMRKDPDIDIWP